LRRDRDKGPTQGPGAGLMLKGEGEGEGKKGTEDGDLVSPTGSFLPLHCIHMYCCAIVVKHQDKCTTAAALSGTTILAFPSLTATMTVSSTTPSSSSPMFEYGH